jgi:hypothetical protein
MFVSDALKRRGSYNEEMRSNQHYSTRANLSALGAVVLFVAAVMLALASAARLSSARETQAVSIGLRTEDSNLPWEQPSEAPPSDFSLQIIWPRTLELGRSETIEIVLSGLPPGLQGIAGADTPLPVGLVTAVPVPTPAFPVGPKTPADVSARLAGAAFTLVSASSEVQPVRSGARWIWNVIGTSPGSQIIDGVVELTLPNSAQPTRPYRALLWRDRLAVEVTQPWITVGQLNLLALLSGLVGSALSVPWIYERMRQERRRAR